MKKRSTKPGNHRKNQPSSPQAVLDAPKPRRKATFKIETLEPRILMSATWVDTDTSEVQSDADTGNDTYTGTEASDTADGLAGNDILHGGDGDDTLLGNSGDDTLDGGAGNDTLDGGGDNDTVFGDIGDDTIRFTGAAHGNVITVDGGQGTDTLDLSQFQANQVTNDGSHITVDLGGGQSFQINHTGIENVVTAAAANSAPTASDGALTISEDVSSAITLAGTDPDAGDAVDHYVIDSTPDHGSLLLNGNAVHAGDSVSQADIAAGHLTFTPETNWSGDTSIGFHAHDGDALSANAGSFAIHVGAANDAPTATDGSVHINEDGSGAITLAGTDPDAGDAVDHYVIDATPDHGTLLFNGSAVHAGDSISQADIDAGHLTYTAEANWHGDTSITFHAHDGDALSANAGSFAIHVDAANDAPVASGGAMTINEDASATAVTLTGTDPDTGDAVDSYQIETVPVNGTLTLNGQTVTAGTVVTQAQVANGDLKFTPSADFNGSTSFTYKAHDGEAWSTSAGTFSVQVNPVDEVHHVTLFEDANDGQGYTSFGQMAAAYDAFADDADGVVGMTGLSQGTILGEQYRAEHGVWFSGASGGQYSSSSGVRAEAGAIAEHISGYDGSYMPNGDNVYVKFSNNDVNNPFTIHFDAPVSSVGAFVGMGVQGTNHTLTIRAYDANNGLVAEKVLDTNLWEANSSTQNYEGFFGIKTDGAFISKVEILNASNVEFANALIIDNIAWSNNDAPVVSGGALTINEDASATAVTLSATDANTGDAIEQYRIETVPVNGSLTLNGQAVMAGQTITQAQIAHGDLKFAPSADFNGSTSFTYKASDGDAWSASAGTFNLTVNAVNDGPTASGSSLTINEDASAAAVTLTGTDPDAGDSIEQYRIDTVPTNGSLTINGVAVTAGQTITQAQITNGDLKFAPSADFNGSTSFTYSAHDGEAWSASAGTFNLTVNAVNDGPVATGGALTINEDASATAVTLTGTDPDAGDSVEQYRIETVPTTGSLTLNGTAVTAGQTVTALQVANGDLKFTPGANSNGSTSFTYSAHDGEAWSANTGTFNLTVSAVNDAPTVTSAGALIEGSSGPASIQLGGADSDSGDSVELFRIETLPEHGTLTLNGHTVTAGQTITQAEMSSGQLQFSPDRTWSGSTEFTFRTSDGDDWSDSSGTFSLTVSAPDNVQAVVTPGTATSLHASTGSTGLGTNHEPSATPGAQGDIVDAPANPLADQSTPNVPTDVGGGASSTVISDPSGVVGDGASGGNGTPAPPPSSSTTNAADAPRGSTRTPTQWNGAEDLRHLDPREGLDGFIAHDPSAAGVTHAKSAQADFDAGHDSGLQPLHEFVLPRAVESDSHQVGSMTIPANARFEDVFAEAGSPGATMRFQESTFDADGFDSQARGASRANDAPVAGSDFAVQRGATGEASQLHQADALPGADVQRGDGFFARLWAAVRGLGPTQERENANATNSNRHKT